jgi:hypothetical protein
MLLVAQEEVVLGSIEAEEVVDEEEDGLVMRVAIEAVSVISTFGATPHHFEMKEAENVSEESGETGSLFAAGDHRLEEDHPLVGNFEMREMREMQETHRLA